MSRPRSLRRDLSLGVALGVVGLWIAALLLAGAVLRHELNEVSDSVLQEASERILSLAVVELMNSDDEFAARRISPLGADEEYLTYAVYDAGGRVLLYSHDVHRKVFSGEPRLGFWDRHGYRLYGADAVSGAYRIAVAEPLKHRRETLLRTVAALAWPMAALLPLTVLWVWWLTRIRLRPMSRLSDAIRDRNETDLTSVVTEGLQLEFLPLADSVNRLMQRMSRALEAERAFTSSAAHELRTPIAAALAQVQRLVRELEREPQRQRARALEAELKRLARLAEKLLQLARAEGAGVLRKTESDLVPILVLTLDDFRHELTGRPLRVEMPDYAPSHIDPDAFGILVRNLIENALNHSPTGTPIDIALTASGKISVANDCRIVPPDRLTRLTQRFERGTTGGLGSGLGLAIAETISRAANGSLELFSPIPGQAGGFLAVFDPLGAKASAVRT
ncbi:ATP-binding protein [Brevundimonas sp.]|uniref:ATP-binding protein n=1 Tax=Brevundimonas sp. TaxID=1871086 RepID=UPI00271A9513|nr:ATP-binding protein [Brevundimonas sp.]MDO9587409.1 histidine kinase dimerization/phospho-acceptor domain-containing protein [Brevundimonas sp.]HWQ87668.1 ATP-binding protein [Brevundimonas sp.]